MPGGAPKGSRNRHNAMLVERAIRRSLARTYGSVTEGLIALTKKHVEKAAEGDAQSFNTILDRLAGKAHQTVSADVTNTVVDLRDAATLENKLNEALAGRMGEPSKPQKPTLQ
jgi:hypothetical protein